MTANRCESRERERERESYNLEKGIKERKGLYKSKPDFLSTAGETNGITLIALVATIVVLLILAGVTITMVLGENGIITQAQKAAQLTLIANEREYLEQNVISAQLSYALDDTSSKKLGEELNTRNLEHTSDWHIIKANDKTYGTDWNYVEKGTKLGGYGEAKYSWLVNYQTGEVIQLEGDNYINLSAGDMLAVKDSLIINVDSSIIDENVENSKTALEKQLGDGVTLENFNYNSESGLTSTSFNFDGVNDYIKVPYDKQEQKDTLAKNGFTFEFYGIWDGGTSYNDSNDKIGYSYRGLFCYWNGNETEQAKFRFGIDGGPASSLMWNAGGSRTGTSDFSNQASHWNICYNIDLSKLKKGAYITITLDTSKSYTVNEGNYEGYFSNVQKHGEYYKQTVYMDGEKLYEGDYNKEQWSSFCKQDLQNLKYFCLGRSSFDQHGWWHYSKMNAYCLRLYSRGLSEEEVMKNYEKSVEYHALIENN